MNSCNILISSQLPYMKVMNLLNSFNLFNPVKTMIQLKKFTLLDKMTVVALLVASSQIVHYNIETSKFSIK